MRVQSKSNTNCVVDKSVCVEFGIAFGRGVSRFETGVELEEENGFAWGLREGGEGAADEEGVGNEVVACGDILEIIRWEVTNQ